MYPDAVCIGFSPIDEDNNNNNNNDRCESHLKGRLSLQDLHYVALTHKFAADGN